MRNRSHEGILLKCIQRFNCPYLLYLRVASMPQPSGLGDQSMAQVGMVEILRMRGTWMLKKRARS